MIVTAGAGISAVSFVQRSDLVQLEYEVNDFIQAQIDEGASVVSVVLTPVFVEGAYDYFATITVALGADDGQE